MEVHPTDASTVLNHQPSQEEDIDLAGSIRILKIQATGVLKITINCPMGSDEDVESF
jgi:hypothetical protein